MGALGALLATTEVGFSRDESFYFEYGESYDNWLVEVLDAEGDEARAEVLGRKKVLKTWKGNFEHPPLMKSLFGLSRRAFGRKDRAVEKLRTESGAVLARVPRLARSDGFDVGAVVELLAPLPVGGSATDPSRHLATGTVVEREPKTATVRFERASLEELLSKCALDSSGSRPPIVGCQVREDRVLAATDEATAMRLPAMVFSALVIVFTFLLGLRLFSWQVGLFAAVAFFCIPRHFYHAHLSCFDMPIVAATVATYYAFWRSLDDRRWALVAGLFWGVALLIKHNAFFLPAPLIICWLWFGRDTLSLSLRRWPPKVSLPPLPLAFLVMPVVGLTLFFVAWPRLWYDPFVALSEYFSFHLEHVHYLQWYFGEPLQVPPFPIGLPFSLTVMTVPEVLTLLCLTGLVIGAGLSRGRQYLNAVRERQAPTHHEKAFFFTLINGFFPILLIALPSVPIFGGVKHWMTAMPFLMILAGFGFLELSRMMFEGVRPRVATFAVLGLACLILAGGASDSIRSLPYGPSYYNAHVSGGIQGAADSQMMRTYWGVTTHEALDWLNKRAPRNARVYFQNTPHRAMVLYQRVGRLRADIRPVRSPGGASIAIVEPQKSFTEAEDLSVRKAFRQPGPTWTVKFDGVNMLRVYTRSGVKLLGGSGETGS